jgi:alkylglycerol monooxygenase
MHLNYLALVVPGFLLMLGIEYLVAKKQNKAYFSYDDSILNISIGIAERLLNLFVVGIFYQVFDYIHRNYALLDIPENVYTWIILFMLVDLVWYWYHRFGHEVNLFWSAHIVHHQSEEFNFTVSARITVFQYFIRTGFWCVLPLIGFPASMLAIMLLIHGAYAFFLHTRLVGKLGFLEHIIVTPSHHRVHHASNEQYLDKNYGDMLIIWDKLFGTYAEEKEEPVYGLTKPLESKSFLWQHFHFTMELFTAVKQTKGLWNKVKLLFSKPEHVPGDIRAELEKTFLQPKKKVTFTNNLRGYVTTQLVISLAALFCVILFEHYLTVPFMIVSTLFILITLINCGAILEQRSYIFYLEFIRMILLSMASYMYLENLLVPTMLGVCVVYTTLYFTSMQKRYYRLVYGMAK